MCTDGRCFCRSPFTGPRCELHASVTSAWYATVGSLNHPAAAQSGSGVDEAPAAAGGGQSISASPESSRASPATDSGMAEMVGAVVPDQAMLVPRTQLGKPIVSSRLQLARQPYDDGADTAIAAIEDVNSVSRFLLNAFAIFMIILACCILSFVLRHNRELSSRLMFVFSGDTKLRANAADMLGASILPGHVVRIERIIIHDVKSQIFESLDVFVEVDFGTNMLAATRCRHVQPVSAALEPGAMSTLPVHDRPKRNRVVFTERLEFNLRPLMEAPMIIRVKDQDVIGNDLLGTVEIDASVVLKKANENARSGQLNYPAALSLQLLDANGQHIDTRILIWFSVPI